MEARELIYCRRSCRDFDGREVPLEDLKTIARAATVAPSGLGKNELIYVILHGEKAQEYLELVRKLQGSDGYFGARSIILVVRDRERGGLYDIDAGCGIENMYLTACDMGIGVCNLHLARGLFCSREGQSFQHDVLNLDPARYEILESTAFGYAREKLEPNVADEERIRVA